MALKLRARDLLIGALATAGFVAILRFGQGAGQGGDQDGGDDPPAATPRPTAVPAIVLPPAGVEPTPAPGEISVLTLLGEMAELDHLARLPAARFSAGLAASTDRRSQRPEDADGWFANDDFVTDSEANLVRVDTAPDGGKRYVLLDEAGPGAVVRIWTATPAGTLRLYIDDDPRPALEAPMAALLSGGFSPFPPPLAQVTARGYNLYFPFPYRRRCVVTVDSIVSPDPFSGRPVAKLYYQIGTRRYRAADAANIRPYAATEIARAGATLHRIVSVLRDGLPTAAPRPGRSFVSIAAPAVTPDHPSVTTLAARSGGARVSELRLALGERGEDKLRATWLTITVDGEETVRAPLVDFFGTGPGVNPYASLPMTVGADGALVCRFPMPFRQRAVVTILRERTSPEPVEISGRIAVDAAPFDARTLLFHARWRPRELVGTRPFRDWRVGTLTGNGHLVGTVLDVENPPGTSWWGEGDEKIFVDGESFPSLFGTGTEDYFGYAWSQPETFAHAYHAQTRAPSGGFGGRFSMNRFHVLDPIPFERSLRFDLEIWHWSSTSIAVDATLYWYARPGGRDDFPRNRTESE